MNNPNDRQVAGKHYASGYQHWDLVADLGLGYFEGQITKYVSRAHKKNGLQDLEKAAHFLEKLTHLATQYARPPQSAFSHNISVNVADRKLRTFAEQNGVQGVPEVVLRLVARWAWLSQLTTATEALDKYLEELRATEPGAGYVNQGD